MAESTSDVEPGFDLAATRDALLDWLMANGVVSAEDVPPSPDNALSEKERDVTLWARARDAALVHISLHGVIADEQLQDGHWHAQLRCDEPSCVKAAVSFALEELCSYWADQLPRALTSKLDHVASVLEQIDPKTLEDLDGLVSAALPAVEQQLVLMREKATTTSAILAERGDDAAAKRILEHAHDAGNPLSQWKGLLELCQRLAKSTAGNRVLCRQAATAVRSRSSLHHLPRPAGAGRQKQTLLDAVLQHLKLGDVSYREMSELIVGMADGVVSTSPEARMGQIRQRIRGRDLRTIRPGED